MNISELKFQPSTSVAEAIERSATILQSVGVDPAHIAIWLLRQHSKFDAMYSNVYQEASELVEWLVTQSPPSSTGPSAPQQSITTLTATQLGQMLVAKYPEIDHPPSAQRINQALEKLELQCREKSRIWRLTERGQKYGRVVSVTDEQERGRLQVRWLPTVLDLLAPLFGIG